MSASSNGAHHSIADSERDLPPSGGDRGPELAPPIAPSRSAARALSLILRGASVAAPWVAILRGDASGRALSWLGLTRRRSPLQGVATFGAGAIVGAGVALLVAPTSGAELRARLLRVLGGASQKTPDPQAPDPQTPPLRTAPEPDPIACDRGAS
jgi:hypothetical protein